MPSKEPVLLTVLIQTNVRRWFVGGIDLQGRTLPLLRSIEGDFDEYLELKFEDQVSFLRHRFASVLQQGRNELWHQQKKPECIVFVADGLLDSAAPELSQRVADHFVTWLTKPPVTFLSGREGFLSTTLQTLAGKLTDEQQAAFDIGLPNMIAQLTSEDLWQQVQPRPK